MDLAISAIFLAGVAGLHALGPGWAALVLFIVGAALATWWIYQGRWQSTPLLVVFLLCVVVSVIWWESALPVWVSATVLVLAVPALLIVYWSPPPHTPTPAGQYGVGVAVAEVPPVDGSGAERLQIHLWYPAAGFTSLKPRRFHTKQESDVYSASLQALGAPGFLQNHFRLGRTNSAEEASIADGEFPLVVFNHGGAMWPTTNFTLMESLASSGYIVCSVSHPGESAGVLWSDGSSTLISKAYVDSLRQEGEGLAQHASYLLCQERDKKRTYIPALAELYKDTLTAATDRWATRSIAIVDWLLSGECSGSVAGIASRILKDAVVYTGMSLGGSVAHECCYRDQRAIAGINLDGMNWNFDRIDSDVPVPFLQFYNDPTIGSSEIAARAGEDLDALTDLTSTVALCNDFYYESPSHTGRRDDVLRIIVPGAAHMTFTDFALTARGPMRKLAGIGTADGRAVSSAVNELCRKFLADALAGKGFESSREEANRGDVFVVQQIDH